MSTGERSLEARLRSAAADAVWPATPAIRGPVLARIAAVRATPPISGRPVARAIVLALLALLVLAGVASALGFRLPGLELVFVPNGTPASPMLAEPLVTVDVVPGSPVPLVAVRGSEPPRVLVPAALPEPGVAFIDGSGGSRMVTLAWHAPAGEPPIAGTDLALVLTAMPGRIDEPLVRKLIGPGTSVEEVRVGGDLAWWITGAPHELLVLAPGGEVAVLRSRLAGDTLVFARGGTLYRLESSLGRDRTLAIAETLR